MQDLSPEKPEQMDRLRPETLSASEDTEPVVDQMNESRTEETADSLASAQQPSAAANSVAFTALSGNAGSTTAGTESPTDSVPRNHGDMMEKEDCDNTNSGREVPSRDSSESENHAKGAQTRGESPRQDLSPVTERVGEGADCKTSITSDVNELKNRKAKDSTEKESTEMEMSVEQEDKADGKVEEEENPAEEVSTQPKKRRMVCKECGKVFNRRETFNLHRHFHLHEDELKPLTCKECGLTFQQRSMFIKHRNEHKENEKNPEPVKKGAGKVDQGAFKCAECARVFFSLNKLRNHRCSNSDDVPFHCPICRQDFMYRSAISRHMFTHSKDRLQCAECDQTFADVTSLRTHQHSHVFHKPYECPDCGMAFKQYSLMVDHRRKHTEKSVSFPCNVCGKSFKYIGLLQQHQYLHTGQKPFHCSECGKSFAFAQNLKAHYRQHSLKTTSSASEKLKSNNAGQNTVERAEKENMAENKDLIRTYNCPLCDQNYTTPANLRNHMHVHEAEYESIEGTSKESMQWDKGHNCPHCSDVYSDESTLNAHIYTIHKSDAPNIQAHPQRSDYIEENFERIRPFKCPDCSKCFRHRSVLELHKRIHSKEKTHQCIVCGKSFNTSKSLEQHVTFHHKKPYKCTDCGKEFAFLQTLKNHEKLHQEKPFRCTYCPKAYSDEAQLQQHVLSHNGDKPHKCHICDKRFEIIYQLRDHMNTHSGDRPHQCEECGKTFTWLSSLLVHQKNAHKRHNTNHFNSFPLGDTVSDRFSDLSGATSGLSKAFSGSDMIGLSGSSDSAREAEVKQISDQLPSISAVGIDLKQHNKPVLSELPPPVQWKVDGGDILPAIQQTYSKPQAFDNPSLSLPMPGQTIETSRMMESSLSYVSPGPTVVPKNSSPSSASEIEQQRQLKTVPWSGPTSVVASTSSLHTEFAQSGTYIDGAALWSVRPTAPNPTSLSTPKKTGQEVQFTSWQGAPMPTQKDLSTPPKKEESRPWDIGNSHVKTVSQPEKPWASGLPSASSLGQMAHHGIGTRWDIQTSPGIQQTLNSPDRLVTNPDFHLQQKQVSPNWASVQSPNSAPNVPISIQYDPHRFGQAIGAPVWGFQSNPVGQTILKPGNVQELQHQQPMGAGTKIILNQPPPFFPLPPMALPPSHPLHSVPVGALPRPPHPNMFFPPQAVTQTLSLSQLPVQREPHKLGPRLSFPPDRLHQCMICGCSLPREVDLQMHYMQHAQGKI